MMEEVGDGDGMTEVRHLGDIFPHIIVEREPSLQCEPLDGRRGKLLGDGGDVEDGRRSDRDAYSRLDIPYPRL
jgi:hypothetical protein